MKKKMVCFALFSTLALGLAVCPAQATSDEYAPTAEELSPGAMEEYVPSPEELGLGAMEDDGLPLNYELELEETDQPFMTDESFPVEEEVAGEVIGERAEEESPEMTGASVQ